MEYLGEHFELNSLHFSRILIASFQTHGGVQRQNYKKSINVQIILFVNCILPCIVHLKFWIRLPWKQSFVLVIK